MKNFCSLNLSLDMNNNGIITISDVGYLFRELFHAPGMFLINLIQETRVGLFFEASYYKCRGSVMSTFSMLFWASFLLIIFMYGPPVKDWLLGNPPKR